MYNVRGNWIQRKEKKKSVDFIRQVNLNYEF